MRLYFPDFNNLKVLMHSSRLFKWLLLQEMASIEIVRCSDRLDL